MKRPLAIILIFILIVLMPIASAQEEDIYDLRELVIDAYIQVSEAYDAGGDVSNIIDQLNKAINLIENASSTNNQVYIDEARSILNQVLQDIPDIKREGERRVFWGNVTIALGLAISAILVVLAYLYLPRIYFRAWRSTRKRNRVHIRRSRANRYSMIIDEEVWAVVLAITVVIAVFAASQILLAGRVVEPFSELGLLGENMKIGDYPTDLVVGDEAFFYVYVGNHMGRPMYYKVLVKIGDVETAIDPAPVPPIYTFEKILMHNDTWIFPVSIPMNEPAVNLRLIVELWIYNQSIGDFQYHKRWTQLWINVTSI